MANQKLSQLVVITAPVVGADEMYVIRGGVSLRVDLAEMLGYVEDDIDPDNISFTDGSPGGIAANNVGDALRELDDNFDEYLIHPQMPIYAFGSLPAASAFPRMFAYATGTSEGDVPVYSDGVQWKYFSSNVNASAPVPSANLSIVTITNFTNPSLDLGVGMVSGDAAITSSVPSVDSGTSESDIVPVVDVLLITTVPTVVNTTP